MAHKHLTMRRVKTPSPALAIATLALAALLLAGCGGASGAPAAVTVPGADPPAAAKAPPSFALWAASESAWEDSVLDPKIEQCSKHFSSDDLRAGECVAGVAVETMPMLTAGWERGLARTARPQTAACKRAIHAYWLAARKNSTAHALYFKAHAHTRITDIQSDLLEEPYATLESLKDQAKSRAVRVCG